jgi:hypothetical protein
LQREGLQQQQQKGPVTHTNGNEKKNMHKPAATQRLNTKDKDKKNEVFCVGCQFELKLDNFSGISCRQAHHFCGECGEMWLNTIFADGLQQFPPTCPVCKVEYNLQVVERNIKKEQHLNTWTLTTLHSAFQLQDGEVWVVCPFCSYREVRATRHLPMLVFCRNGTCSKRSCFHCHKEVTAREIADYQEAEADDDDGVAAFAQHLACSEYGELKAKIERTIAEGTSRKCPKCGTKGRKDNSCTHMTCPDCQTIWCYVCGLDSQSADKASAGGSIYDHNTDWWKNPKRCPMYLSAINDVDDTWPQGDDDAALDHFHKLLTLKLLHELLRDQPAQVWSKVQEVFPQVLGGFSVVEIASFDPDKHFYKLDPTLQL